MRDFLIIWAFLVLNYYLGYKHRGWVDARKREREQAALRLYPSQATPEFKAWLADYIAVNTPRRDP